MNIFVTDLCPYISAKNLDDKRVVKMVLETAQLLSSAIVLKGGVKFIPDGDLTEFANCSANQSLNISYKHLTDVTMAYKLYLADRWENDKREPTWR